MSDMDHLKMEEDEVDEFLGVGGVGVISFSTSRGEPPHTIPVSYGYDSLERKFYFRLEVDPESRKKEVFDQQVDEFVDEKVHASFVTVNETENGWRSVVAHGKLVEVGKSGDTESLQAFERVDLPLMDMFGKPSREVDFRFYRLEPDELTGYREKRMES
ncbi:MAG: pyridoxamine 5'-phosphate oxidase family protein [Halobacteria archaeon]